MDSLRTLLWIVWGTFAAAIAVYFGLVAYGLRAEHPFLPDDGVRGLALGLGFCCALLAGASWWLRVGWIERPIARGRVAVATPQGARRVLMLFLAVWGLGEAVGLAGFLLYYGGAPVSVALPFLSAAAGLHLVNGPFAGRLERSLTPYEMATGQGRIG